MCSLPLLLLLSGGHHLPCLTQSPTLSTPSSLPTLIDIGSREGMVNNDQGTCALLKGGGGWFVRDLTPPPRAGGR